ncbi:membrane-spanning 4-domains subfamily A member 5-like [Ambystoma mexicanum]|uniref:membrane-spanning 4-domains subfamily A member 5-like n=1 Tax=Ambystoma mexicanum TaxID=8296 RepID=UPI0037E77A75
MATMPAGNGVFVVTQYIPAANTNTIQQEMSTRQTSSSVQNFIKGEPKALGVVQIMIGVISVFLGGILCSSSLFGIVSFSGVPFWGAFFFFISGGLSVSAEKKGTRCFVNGSVVMNIFSAIVAVIGSSICAIDLASGDFYFYSDDDYYYSNGCRKHDENCRRYSEALLSYQVGILVVLLLLWLLEMFICMTVSCYGCKSVGGSSSRQVAQPLFVGQNHYSQDPRVLATQATGMPAAHGLQVLQEMPKPYELPVVPGICPELGVVAAVPTAPPPSYYKDVPGDHN